MNLMHISLDLSVRKVFKNTRKGVACTGACLRSQVNQAQTRRYQSRNYSRPEIPKVVAHDSAKIIKIYYLSLEYNFPSRNSENLGFPESVKEFIGQGVVWGFNYQTWLLGLCFVAEGPIGSSGLRLKLFV